MKWRDLGFHERIGVAMVGVFSVIVILITLIAGKMYASGVRIGEFAAIKQYTESLDSLLLSIEASHLRALAQASISPEFTTTQDTQLDSYRFRPVTNRKFLNSAKGIRLREPLVVGDLNKGLPEETFGGSRPASQRRMWVRKVLRKERSIDVLAQSDATGYLIFAEPYSIQRQFSSFQLSFASTLAANRQLTSIRLVRDFVNGRTGFVLWRVVVRQGAAAGYVLAATMGASILSQAKQFKLPPNLEHASLIDETTGEILPLFERPSDLRPTLEGFRLGFGTSDHCRLFLTQGTVGYTCSVPGAVGGIRFLYNGILPLPDLTIIAGIAASLWFLGSVFVWYTVSIFGKRWSRINDQNHDIAEHLRRNIGTLTHDLGPVLHGLRTAQRGLSQAREYTERNVATSEAANAIRSTSLQLSRTTASLEQILDSMYDTLVPANYDTRGRRPTLYLPYALRRSITEASERHRPSIGPDAIKLEIDESTEESHCFVIAHLTELDRVMANLLDNAVEACESSHPSIRVTLSEVDNTIYLRVIDNGVGIASAARSRVFADDYSTKQAHKGRGLTSCQEIIRNRLGGDIQIESSVVGAGTTVLVTLKAAEAPQWFIRRIVLNASDVVVIIDDEEEMHETWQHRFQKRYSAACFDLAGPSAMPSLAFVSDPSELSGARSDLIRTGTRFFVDYRLKNYGVDGLSLIQDLGILDRAYLVTNFVNDPVLANRANAMGVKMIPKAFLFDIGLSVELGKAHASS